MKKVINIIKKVILGILSIILASEVYLIAVKLINPSSYPTVFGFSKAIVLSDSMAPEFYKDDLLIFLKKSSYESRDIIIFDDRGSYTTHRVVDQTDDGKYITKGDANNSNDANSVSIDQIHGKVILIIPGAGKIVKFFRTTEGVIFLISGVVLVFVLTSYFDKKEENKEVE